MIISDLVPYKAVAQIRFWEGDVKRSEFSRLDFHVKVRYGLDLAKKNRIWITFAWSVNIVRQILNNYDSFTEPLNANFLIQIYKVQIACLK